MLHQKRLAGFLAVVLVATAATLTGAAAAPTRTPASVQVHAPHTVLMDARSGDMLFAQGADDRVFPASTTKIMTLVVVLEAMASGRVSLDDPVTASEYACSFGGTQVYATPGETHRLEDWLLAVVVGSANDGSVVVAEHVAGSEQRFADMMNAKALELGMHNTHYVNPHGLHHDEHFTSASDMARLARHALTVPGLLEITGIYRATFRDGTFGLDNYNRLVRTYPGCDGLKTGHTSNAGYCLVATAQRDESRFIAVAMNSGSAADRNADVVRMLDYAFANYRSIPVAEAGERLGTAQVHKGAVEEVQLIAPAQYGLTVDKGKETGIELNITLDTLTAPVALGQVAGEIQLLREGEVLATFPLVCEATVERIGFLSLWRKLLQSLLSGR